MTNGELVSMVVGSMNSITKDGRISRRLVLSIAKNYVKDFLSKRLSEKRGINDLNIVTVMPCVEMIQDNYVTCGVLEFRKCKDIARTKYKLPELIEGTSVVSAFSIDHSQKIYPTTLSAYARNKNRAGKSEELNYYIRNGYLYIPDTKVRTIELEVITLDPIFENECDNVWDQPFIVPEKLIRNIVNATAEEIYKIKRIPKDENPNLNANN